MTRMGIFINLTIGTVIGAYFIGKFGSFQIGIIAGYAFALLLHWLTED